MKRESEAMAKGAALGVVAGAAAGMAGAYLASENKTEIKKFVKLKKPQARRWTSLTKCAVCTIKRVFKAQCP